MREPEEIAYKFSEYWNKKDARALADLFAENADFINVVGLWWDNKEDIYKAHDYGLRVIFAKSTIRVIKTKLKKMSDSHAIVYAKMRLQDQTDPEDNAKTLSSRRNIFTFVMEKVHAEWYCISAHNTDIVPGNETHVVKDGVLKAADYRKKSN